MRKLNLKELGVKGAWVEVNVHSFLLSLFPSFIHSFISYSVPKDVLWLSQTCFPITAPTAPSLNLQYPLVSFRSSCRCLCLLRRPPLNYNLPSFFHAIWSSIRRFLIQMWPIKLHVLLFIVRKLLIFFLPIYNTFSFAKKKLNKINFFVHLQHHNSMLSRFLWSAFWSVQCSAS